MGGRIFEGGDFRRVKSAYQEVGLYLGGPIFGGLVSEETGMGSW